MHVRSVIRWIPVLLIAAMFSGFRPVSSESVNEGAVVLIDGKEVKPEGTLEFARDETLQLEASGIQPNSLVNIKVKKLGIRWMERNYQADKEGMVKGIFDTPESKITISCKVNYFSADGDQHEVEFKVKVH